MIAACAARRWLARNAAGVKSISNGHMDYATPLACASLVACLPALETVELLVSWSLYSVDMGSLLEALSWCPRLSALHLWMEEGASGTQQPQPRIAEGESFRGFGALRSLASLDLLLCEEDVGTFSGDMADAVLTDVVGGLAPLTGLVGLTLVLWTCDRAEVPECLGQLKGLRSLQLTGINACALADGCLDLPNLESLAFLCCGFGRAEALPGVSALQNLTRFEFRDAQEHCFFDPGLVQLPRLQHVVFDTLNSHEEGYHGLARLPPDMGALRSTLQHLNVEGHELTRFPLAVTQLAALECLMAGSNDFVELPTAITALSRLTELRLGRVRSSWDPLQRRAKHPLDARALGDLSGFPALRVLSFRYCEVMFCMSLLGAVRHPSLATLDFGTAHPAPECEPVVLQLSQALRRLGRGSVLKVYDEVRDHAQDAKLCPAAPLPVRRFMAALEACAP